MNVGNTKRERERQRARETDRHREREKKYIEKLLGFIDARLRSILINNCCLVHYSLSPSSFFRTPYHHYYYHRKNFPSCFFSFTLLRNDKSDLHLNGSE